MDFGLPSLFWKWLTRFGELGIVLPLALAVAAWLLLAARSLRPAIAWMVPLGIAAALTTASKIAFIGFEYGLPSINFTGFSGHAMFAAAVYPVLAYAVVTRRGHDPAAGGHGRGLVWGAVAAGWLLALLIAYSRVRVGAHSYSEIVLGCALGSAASAAALYWLRATASQLHARWIAVGIAAWLAVMPIQASPSRSHDLVTRIALAVSDRDEPYTRADMERRALIESPRDAGPFWRPRVALPSAAASPR